MGLAFYANLEGWFKAVDAHTGRLLWQFQTGSGCHRTATVFRGQRGRESVAIISGTGGCFRLEISKNLDPRGPRAAKGRGNTIAELKNVTNKGAGTLSVFALRTI